MLSFRDALFDLFPGVNIVIEGATACIGTRGEVVVGTCVTWGREEGRGGRTQLHLY